MIKMSSFLQRQNLAAIKQVEEQEEGNKPSTSMSLHAATSAPAAAVGPPAAGGAKPKRKRQKVLDTVFLSLFKGKKLYTDKWMNICRSKEKWKWFMTLLLSTRKT